MKLFNPKTSTSEEIKYQLDFNTRIAEDKLFNKVSNKINRKSTGDNLQNIPWFVSMIKDFKRLSLVFYKSDDIVLFVDQLKVLFGSKFEKDIKDGDICIRIREIKNKFEA